MRKRRTREHVIADLSINFVEKQVLLAGFVAERQVFDYGYDLQITTFDDAGEVEPGHLFVQVKASDRVQGREANHVTLRVERRDMERWCREWIPILLVLYDVDQDCAYFRIIRREHLPAGESITTTLILARDSVLSIRQIQLLAEEKRQAQRIIEDLLNGTDERIDL